MRFDHFAFQVDNLERGIAFYVSTLGFSESWRHRNEEENEECVFLILGDIRLELLAQLSGNPLVRSKPQSPFCPHLAIGVEDLDASIAKLRSKNVEILRGPLQVEGKVRWLYFADPDQNVIELVEWL